MSWVKACSTQDVSEGEPLHVKLNNIEIGIYKLNDEYFALEDVCPHAYALLTQGFIEDDTIECPLHEAIFEIRTGHFIKGPDCRHLITYQIRQEGDDLYINLGG